MQQTYRYRNIIIKPHWMQFVINELHLFVLISVGFVYAGIDDAVLSTLVFVLSSQTFMQQLFHLKTVSIYSGDRTTPRLDIIGVPMKEELVAAIRERVETNKRRRSIYEITNR